MFDRAYLDNIFAQHVTPPRKQKVGKPKRAPRLWTCCGLTTMAQTKSEARASIKQKLGVPRLAPGAVVSAA